MYNYNKILQNLIVQTRSDELKWYLEMDTKNVKLYKTDLNILKDKKIEIKLLNYVNVYEFKLNITLIENKLNYNKYIPVFNLSSKNNNGKDLDMVYYSIVYKTIS